MTNRVLGGFALERAAAGCEKEAEREFAVKVRRLPSLPELAVYPLL